MARRRSVYKDEDGKEFSSLPFNYLPQRFIDEEINTEYGRGGHSDETLPSWVQLMAKAEQSSSAGRPRVESPCTPPTSTPRTAKHKRIKTPGAPRKRTNPVESEVEEARDQIRELKVKLESALHHIADLNVVIKAERDEKLTIILERDRLREENIELKEKIEALEKNLKESKFVLSYDDLKPGGVLDGAVKQFTFFPNFACNDAFLHLINYTDGCEPGDGLCKNMVRYSKVSMEDRKECNNAFRAARKNKKTVDISVADETSSGDDSMSACSDSASSKVEDVYMEEFEPGSSDGSGDSNGNEEDADGGGSGSTSARRGRNRKVSWQTEWLIYNFYARCNISMKRVAKLFGIGTTMVHDIVYAWANVLCIALSKFFPTPTRSQMLRAYPKSMIKKFGHANIFMLLDATESFAEIASMKTVNSVLFSAYKHNSTLKWLVGSDGIGTTWDESISDAYPGAISDPISTAISEILDQVPYGSAVEVDKGFLIDNECARLGIVCIRPMKMLEKQTQQSKEDVALTQKVGKTRIAIEQANGQMKRGTAFFDKRIKISQIGLADLIFRSSYLLQNFKLGFIQERVVTDEPAEGRPCKAEIRWYGATDDGLHDVRPDVELWGMEVEIKHWNELRDLPANKKLSDTKISEIVLAKETGRQY